MCSQLVGINKGMIQLLTVVEGFIEHEYICVARDWVIVRGCPGNDRHVFDRLE